MKEYILKFGTGDPANFSGLSPTFTFFYQSSDGTTLAPPSGASEVISGAGLYHFQSNPTLPITFVVDGGTSLADGDRFITGVLDPLQAVDEKLGTLDDTFGSSLIDPQTTLAYLKRLQEILEGNADFVKSTGVWSVYDRGSTTLLRAKTLSNTTTQATKT